MAENSKIGWTDHTFNPWEGCTKVSPACDNCYAEARAARFKSVKWGHGAPRRRTSDANWRKPLYWNLRCQEANTRAKVFCASLADVSATEVPDAWRVDLFTLIERTPYLHWLLLTKRPQVGAKWLRKWCPRNVWFGTTVENQAMAKARIPYLLNSPGPAVRFLSMEPLLEKVELAPWLYDRKSPAKLDWLIVGGESGNHVRPMDPDWAGDLLMQAEAAKLPFFLKQMSGRTAVEREAIPEALRVQQFPG